MASIKLRIHPLFYAFGLYYALTGRIFIFIIYTITALLHEVGHSFIAEGLGYKLDKIILMPYGAMISGNLNGLKVKDEIKVAIAGPTINFLVAVFFVALWWIYPMSYAYTDIIAISNFTLAFINLLPVYPLDGGRILSVTYESLFL